MKKYLLNLAGEYRVCSEILKRGLFASVTLGNMKGADIHVIKNKRTIIVVEVKTTESNRFVTSFYQKYKTPDDDSPDIWVLCKIVPDGEDRFFILTKDEMAKVQADRNGFREFSWNVIHEKCAKGVDNVFIKHIEAFENNWQAILNQYNEI